MDKKINFAVYTSFYNCSKYIDQIFESILSIDYSDWKWFITDDFSTDSTGEIIREKCKDNPKIQYVDQQTKKEMYWRPNHFIPPEYEYILEVDSDDMVSPKILEIYDSIIRKVYRKEPSFITCDLQEVYEEDFSLKSIGYVINYSNIIQKLDSYYPQIDYAKNINYYAFGQGRCFKNYPDLNFEIDDFTASSNDFYRILYMSSMGKWIHVPRNLYTWTARSNSESRKSIDPNFYDNFQIAFDKCKDSLYDPIYDYNECYKELNSLLIEKDLDHFSKISIISPWLSEIQKDKIQEIYPDKKIKFNETEGSDLYSIIANYFMENGSLSKFIKEVKEKNPSGKIIIYALDENIHNSDSEVWDGSRKIFERILEEVEEVTDSYYSFLYLRHINITIDMLNI
jgi:glycosyltransferase involved in cell wall biosynthesis